MKTLSLLPFVFAFTSFAFAEEFGFSENFDTGPGSVAFERFRTFDGESSTFPYTAVEGTSESGAVAVNPGIQAQFWAGDQTSAARIDLGALTQGGTITTSVDLKVRPDYDALTVLTFGFTLNESRSALTQERGKNVAGSLYRPEGSPGFVLRMRNDSTDLDSLELAPDALFAGEWYRLELVLQRATANSVIEYTLTVYSLGNDGQSPPTMLNDGVSDITLTGFVENAEVLESSEALWAIDARSSFDPDLKATRGVVFVDNFVLKKSP